MIKIISILRTISYQEQASERAQKKALLISRRALYFITIPSVLYVGFTYLPPFPELELAPLLLT